MLSSISPDQIIEAISRENVSLIQSVKGIGSKTAQRVIIDLQDKILKVYDLDEGFASSNNTNKEEALSALEVLGINKKSSVKLVNKIVLENPDISVESIIKETLNKL